MQAGRKDHGIRARVGNRGVEGDNDEAAPAITENLVCASQHAGPRR